MRCCRAGARLAPSAVPAATRSVDFSLPKPEPSVVTPSFIPCSQAELIAHYRRIADALVKPVYLYNIPARTGNTIEPQAARILADHPNIIGIKDSAGSQESIGIRT